jgi:hypothetical protein
MTHIQFVVLAWRCPLTTNASEVTRLGTAAQASKTMSYNS